ncbi:MAG: class I SAM-dependent RNA methyltransferase [Deltaproteobacteria bacterium]|nr:class I SAM-dependent RNA methyltransferase [Deltaproteobacteria bacterium]
MKEQIVTIDALTASGDGVARIGDALVRLENTLPGERWLVRREGGAWVPTEREGESEGRVQPGCEAFGRCGGCTWQHASPAVQQAARLDRIRRALPPALRAVPIGYVPSDVAYGYRTRARLHWITPGKHTYLGFLGRRSSNVVDLAGCPVLVPSLDAAMPALREAVTALGGRGEASLALGEGGRPVASLRPERPLDERGYAVGRALLARGFAGVALWTPGATAPALEEDPSPVQVGGDGLPLRASIGGFGQAHGSLNASLAAYVDEEAQSADRAVVELYAGAGNLTVRLARSARTVTAVESDRDAVEALRHNVAARGLTNVKVHQEAVEARTKPWKADVVVLDPPRSGAKEACALLTSSPVRRVVYVSCDPESLGRDLLTLSAKYSLARLTAFEMFPQTALVEVVATLARAGSGR